MLSTFRLSVDAEGFQKDWVEGERWKG